MKGDSKLFTNSFMAINAIQFLYFCNIAVFFSFYQFLGTLPINPEWFGFLISLFSLVGLVVRPLVSPFLHPWNARKWAAISCSCVIISLVTYDFAHGLWSMAFVRSFHGLAHAVMGVAMISALVACIPAGRSGQAFGLVGVLTLLPYAFVPPILGPLTRWTGGFENVLLLSAVAMLPALPLLGLVRPESDGDGQATGQRITWPDLVQNLKSPDVVWLLVLSFVVWTAFTPVFFFLKDYGEQMGIRNPGLFFTLSICTEMGVRLFAGRLLDRFDKFKMLAGSLAWLMIGYVTLAACTSETVFYGLGLFLGLGWGIAMPLLSAGLFDVSESRFRALNSNLNLEMFQAGFVAGPLIGAALIMHSGYRAVYYACAATLALGIVAALRVGKRERGVS